MILDLGRAALHVGFIRAYVAANFLAANQSIGAVALAGRRFAALQVIAFLPVRQGAVA
jgi:hypothetical protein